MSTTNYVSNQLRVPLAGLTSEKSVISGSTHASTCDKMTSCMARMLVGFGGAALVMMGAALIGREDFLLDARQNPFSWSLGVGIGTGVLSETKKDAAINGFLLGVLCQSVFSLSGVR